MTDFDKSLEYQQAITQLDAKVKQDSAQKSTVGYLFWSLFIPPVTTFLVMYFAWKKGVLHLLVPNMAMIYSISFALWSLLMFSSSGAFGSYLNQQVAGVPLFDKVLAIVLTVGGIGIGIYCRGRAKKEGNLSLVWVSLITVILILQVYAGFHQLSFIANVINKAQDTSIGL